MIKIVNCSVLICLLSLLTMCGRKKEEITQYYSDGKLKSKTQTLNGLKDGVMTIYFPNGKLKEVSHYVNDTLEGVREVYFENGQLSQKFTYLKGSKNGQYSLFAENGNIIQSGNFHNDKNRGLILQYYRTGFKDRLHYKSYMLNVSGEQIPYWSIEYDSLGNIVKENRPITIRLSSDSIKLGNSVHVDFELLDKIQMDSSFVIIGDYNDSFELNGNADTLKTQDEKLSIEVKAEKKGTYFLRGQWSEYKSAVVKDTTETYMSFGYFEEEIKVY